MSIGFEGKGANKKVLQEEVVTPLVRNASWRSEAVARILTPTRLVSLLQNSIERYNTEYLTLAEEMEEKDPHYAGVLGVRKRAVSRLQAVVEPGKEEKNAHVELVREVVESPEFESMVYDLMDAIGKGYSVVEILWRMESHRWIPDRFAWRDPRWFMFDEETGARLLIHDPMNYEGREMPAYKFISHIPRLKNGLAIRGGLARLVATSYMCKQFVLSDWMSFIDMYGLPIRIGKYGANATEEDIVTLKRAVASIGVDGAAAIPRTWTLSLRNLRTGEVVRVSLRKLRCG